MFGGENRWLFGGCSMVFVVGVWSEAAFIYAAQTAPSLSNYLSSLLIS
jgi:hypothetical protein